MTLAAFRLTFLFEDSTSPTLVHNSKIRLVILLVHQRTSSNAILLTTINKVILNDVSLFGVAHRAIRVCLYIRSQIQLRRRMSY